MEETLRLYGGWVRTYGGRLWKGRWRWLAVNCAMALLTLLYLLFLVPPFFRSTVSIVPEYGNKPSLAGLADIVSMTGINLGETAPTEIYQNLIQSEAVIGPVILGKYKTVRFKDSVNLIQYFEIPLSTSLPPDIAQRKAFVTTCYEHFLKRVLNTEISRETKILTITATIDDSKLSADIVNNVVQSLDDYVRTRRRSYAANQRFYIEKRLEQVKDSLAEAEEHLRRFREQNNYSIQSPRILLEQSRYVRNVTILDAVYSELVRQLELAKIDEIRDTPIINVKEYAQDPVLRAGPQRVVRGMAIMLFSLVLSSVYVMFPGELRRYWKAIRNT